MARVRVRSVVEETADAKSFVLDPCHGETLSYRPGQFLTVRIPAGSASGVARCYSMSTSPDDGDEMAITVKRTEGGVASTWLCEELRAGMELEVLPPAGQFVPSSLDEDVLLVAGGSGITPLMSILRSFLAAGTGHVHLVYANRDPGSVIFADTLEGLATRHPGRLTVAHWWETDRGLPTVDGLTPVLSGHADRAVYLCGPRPLMDVVTATLARLEVPDEQIKMERFTSLSGDPFAATAPASSSDAPRAELEVTLDGEVTTLPWPVDQLLLDTMLAAGVDAPYSCREGNCSACACVLEEGEVELERNQVLDATDLADGLVLACQARPTTDRVRISFDA